MSEIPGLDGLLGLEYVETSADRVVVRWPVTESHLQPFGLPHGGAYCTVHESSASIGGFLWLDGKGVAVGSNNSTDFLRQGALGDVMTTTATPIFRGRTQQLWHLDTVNQDGKLMAQGQVRLANIDAEVPPEKLAQFAPGRLGS